MVKSSWHALRTCEAHDPRVKCFCLLLEDLCQPEETNPSVVTAGSGAWIRVSEAVKALPSEVTVTAEQAKALLLEPLKRGQILKRLAKESKKENRERWEKKDTSVTLWAGESNTPLQVLEGRSS